MTRWGLPIRSIVATSILALGLCGAAGAATPGVSQADREARVREAMLVTYVHGVTDELAAALIDPGDVPYLRRFLRDERFPRRDNVVAFLAHSDRGPATADLLAFLASPPADITLPEEDRALLLAPQALGRIAARGDAVALDALLEVTSGAEDAGPLEGAARRAPDPRALRADLLEMSLRGLAFSRSPRARARLEAIASGRLRLDLAERDARAAARRSLELLDLLGGAIPQSGPFPGRAGAGGQLDGALVGGTLALSGPSTQLLDTQSRVHNAPLTYANHVNVPNPMTNSRLDSILRDGNLRAGRQDFIGDVACCATFSRSGNAQPFGTPSDGLDVIDNGTEISTVLSDPIARVKVVRIINYCSQPGTNIIGCAWTGGNGMSLVRQTILASEGILWLHEYGHNVGLGHAIGSNYIMYGTINTGGGLSQTECDRYHVPLAGAGIVPVDTGACADSDVDLIHDGVDNCSSAYNPGQADFDADQQGDSCDPDDDNDGADDPADCQTLNAQVWAVPGEAANLTITDDPMGTVLLWDVPAAPGGTVGTLRYDSIQSLVSADFLGGATCVESDNGPNTNSSTAGRAVPFWAGQGNGPGAQLGVSVAGAGDVDNDGHRDVIAGAPTYEDAEAFFGAVLVFPGSAAGPTGTPWKLIIDQSLVTYGGSVDGGGDLNDDGFDDVIAGAPNYDNGLSGEGRVFAYHGSAAGPVAAAWSPSGGMTGAHFGASVALAGDVNNDGFDDVIVGAPDYDNGLAGEGRAFAYHGSASGLGAGAAWSPGGGQAGARFGAAVAAAGDVNGDGYGDVILGAPGHGGGQGRAYIYQGSPSGLGASPSQTLEGSQAGAGFGASVAGAGDVNGDGFDDVIVGAPYHDNDSPDQGRAFVYLGGASGVDPGHDWTVGGDQSSALFGAAVASAGDVSGDGIADVAVGASFYSNQQPFEGRAYLFLGSPSGPRTGAIRFMEEDQYSSGLGSALGGAGDLNGDGLADLLVGAPAYDGNEEEPDEGLIFLYPGSTALEPPPGSAFFYLVRAQNVCGEGPAGFDSEGGLITAIACP